MSTKNTGGNPLCVVPGVDARAHYVALLAGAIRAALSAFLGMDAADMSRIPLSNNTGVAKLMAENGTFQVEYYNDDSHLGSSEQWRYPAAQPNASSGIPDFLAQQ